MVNAEELQSMFSDSGFVSGGEFYVRADAAVAYLDACAQNGLVVLGVEGFLRTGGKRGKLIPRWDLIADFSGLRESNNNDWETTVKASHREAIRFVYENVKEDSGLVISVVVAEESP
jgi:hypothetical protein